MSVLTLTLPQSDADRLAEVAERTGQSVEQAATAALKAQLDAEFAACGEIEAGLAELDAGNSETLEVYEREMDAFVAQFAPTRG